MINFIGLFSVCWRLYYTMKSSILNIVTLFFYFNDTDHEYTNVGIEDETRFEKVGL